MKNPKAIFKMMIGAGILTACTGGMDRLAIRAGNGGTMDHPERQIAEPCTGTPGSKVECNVVISDVPEKPKKTKK